MKIWKVFMMVLKGNVDIKEGFKSTILYGGGNNHV